MSAQKLDKLRDHIHKKYNVDVRVISADFSISPTAPESPYPRIKEELQGIPVGILVNNVGMNSETALYFDELEKYPESKDDLDRMVHLNVVSVLRMTQMVLPGMKLRKRGLVVNVGSGSPRVPTGSPLYSTYGGTKSFVEYFSKSLDVELGGTGVRCQCHIPYFVMSKLSKLEERHRSQFIISPSEYADAAVANMGTTSVVVPYWSHRLQDWVIRSLPHSIVRYFSFAQMKPLRSKWLKKREKAK